MSIGEEIWADINKAVSTKTQEYRANMNSNVHCMDVGIDALKASDPNITYNTKEKIHRELKKEFFVFTSLQEAILHAKDSGNIDRSSFVQDPKFGTYVIGPSYQRLQGRVSKALKNSILETEFTGTDVEGKTTVNIGHLSLNDRIQAATSPLQSKLLRIASTVSNIPIASSMVSRALNTLYQEHVANTNYVFNRKNFDLLSFNDILGSGTVLVVLQTASKNNALSTLETNLEKQVRTYLTSDKFKQKILRLKGSNTILEDIEAGLRAALIGTTKIPGSRHAPRPVNKKSTKLLDASKKVTASPVPRLRNITTGRFTNLVNLQRIINSQLQDVISANMGSGSSRDILNYRTGRFAGSVQVERMTQSREGMITAFYSYMKNPYATFSEGGRQQNPRSRDPKLLIARSIRDIAETQVTNRLRAVIV